MRHVLLALLALVSFASAEHVIVTGGPALRNTSGQLGWLIDTRAGGGYVVGAGSVVDGRRYVVAHDQAATDLPDWLAAALRPAPLPPQSPRGGPGHDPISY